jgi:carboxyl-terminal processing protease
VNKNFKYAIFAPLLIAGGVIVGLLIALWGLGGRRIALSGQTDKISYTMSLIENFYVDPITPDSLAEVAIPVILDKLDPHSVYIPARDLLAVNEPLTGEFDGIGVMFNMLTDTIVVLNVIPSGPSDKAGVQNGDRIIKINDSLVAGQKLPQEGIVKRLRGVRGTTVLLGIERQGSPELVPITVTRGTIPLKSIDAAFMLTPTVGFVKLSTFARNSYSELIKALSELQNEGMTRLVFDLRDNTGGFLDQAIGIANLFLPQGDLIVYTEDRNHQQIKEYADGNGAFTTVPLAVLIDEGSASSSEILAGALQDNDRATIIGRRSFGKGLVQREIAYPDGSALRLTIARYYTPSGRSIQKPYDHGTSEYRRDIIDRYLGDEMFVADSMKHDTLRYFTKGGRVVYGGGGIMPDVFVPLDTVGVTPYYQAVNGRNLIYKYTLEFGDRHREQMNAISTVAQLNKMLDGYPHLVDDFVAYAARSGVKPDWGQIAISRPILAAQLRALVGRNTALDYTGFYAEIYVIDNVMLKAIETLTKE